MWAELSPGHVLPEIALSAERFPEPRSNRSSAMSDASSSKLVRIGIRVSWPVPEKACSRSEASSWRYNSSGLCTCVTYTEVKPRQKGFFWVAFRILCRVLYYISEHFVILRSLCAVALRQIRWRDACCSSPPTSAPRVEKCFPEIPHRSASRQPRW